MPIIKIDDKEYEVESGQNLIQAAASVGIDIPHYCYHPGLSVSGNCRMCLVEVKDPRRGMMANIACNTMVNDGMEVYVETDSVKQMRQGVMEFLLLNHPIDCPICDQAGECGLQDYYMDHGLYTNRSTVPKVNKNKVVDVGPLVVLDQERCILCSRCVRFCSEITKTDELVITQRGEQSRIETFPGKELDNPYSANVVDICPVGALTSKDFRFKKRVWFLSTVSSICTGCSKGCNIELDYEKTTTYRYRPRFNPDVNEYWICDEGRLSYKALHHNRLDTPLAKGEPLLFDAAMEKAQQMLQQAANQEKQSVLALGSAHASFEDNFMLKQMMRQSLSSDAVFASHVVQGQGDDFLKTGDQAPNAQGLSFLDIEMDENALLQHIQSHKPQVILALDTTSMSPTIAKAIKGIPMIYLGSHANEMAKQADLAFPVTLHAEHYATYVNHQNILQKVQQAYFPTTDARPAWQVLKGLFKPLLTAPPLFEDVEDVWSSLRGKYEQLKDLTFYEIPEKGLSLNPQPIEEAPADPEGVAADE